MISHYSSSSRHYACTWSLESFVLPSNLFLLLYVLIHGPRLYKCTHISYYLFLSLLAILRLAHVAINTYASYLPLASAAPHYMFQAIAEFGAGAGFTLLNMTRLFSLAPCRAWSPKLVYSLAAGTAASVAMYLVVTCLIVYLYMVGRMAEDSPAYRFSNEVFSVWRIYDAVLNAGISFAFVWWLRSLAGAGRGSSGQARDAKSAEATTATSSGGGGGFTAPNVRPELLTLLTEIQWLLATECTLVVSATTMQLIAPDLDPLWSVNLTVEAFRLFVFINFFIRLNKVMRTKQIHSNSNDSCPDLLPSGPDPSYSPFSSSASSSNDSHKFPSSYFNKSSLPIFKSNTFPISATNGTPCSSTPTCTCSLKSRLLRMLRSPLHSSTHPDMQSLITRSSRPRPLETRCGSPPRARPVGIDNGTYLLTPIASNVPLSIGWDTMSVGGLSRNNSVRAPLQSQHMDAASGSRLAGMHRGAAPLVQSPQHSWLVATVAAARDKQGLQHVPMEVMGPPRRLPSQRSHALGSSSLATTDERDGPLPRLRSGSGMGGETVAT